MRRSAVFLTGACLVFSLGMLSSFLVFAEQDGEFFSPVEKARGLAHFITGVSYDLSGQIPEAVREYELSVRSDDSVFSAHLRLGSSYARIGAYDDAVRELSLAAGLDKQDVESHYLLALIYTARKDLDRAAGEYEILLKNFALSGPLNADVYISLGQLYSSRGNGGKALEQFEKAFAIAPDNVDLAYWIGELYVEAGRREEARGLFKKCVAAEPTYAGCLNALGYLQVEDGKNLDEAISLIQRALKEEPLNAAFIDSLGWAYYKKKWYDKALGALIQASGILKDPVIYDHLGDVYSRLKRKDMAHKYWQMSFDLDPTQSQLKKKLQNSGSVRRDVR